ncbi:MAG: EAL domain-containing protein [Spirochaetales bacterium]|nr:EAL domain-containing protein [Spirochaetales bacterium]
MTSYDIKKKGEKFVSVASMTKYMLNKEMKDKSFIENIPHAIYIVDIDGEIIFANKHFCSLLGCENSFLINKSLFNLEDESVEVRMSSHFDSAIQSGFRFISHTTTVCNYCGELLNVINNTIVVKNNEKVTAFLGVLIDITEKTEIEKSVSENQNKLSKILKHISEVIAIVDRKGIIKFESESIEYLHGYKLDETVGSSFLERVHPGDRELLTQKLLDCSLANGNSASSEYRFIHKDGSLRHMEVFLQNMYDVPSIQGILVYFKDLTEFDSIKNRAYYLEFNDPLTGLPNKEMFTARLRRELKRAERTKKIFAVMSINLNKFKYINDLYGTPAGDEVLIKVGAKLKSIFRDDDLVSRFEGDKFLVLLSDIDGSQSAEIIFKKTADVFSEPLSVGSHMIRITAGMGICFYPDDGNDSDLLIKNSETAMCNAKNRRLTSYSLFDEKRNNEMLSRIKIEKELQDAIDLKEFCVYYQPKVDVSGTIIGMEALLRWQSPVRGLVPPGLFIPIAEKNGMILQLGEHVLYESCVQNRKWQEKGHKPIQVAVNISPFEFSRADIVSNIKAVLKDTGINPQWLEVEITESGIMENEQDSIEKLAEIHNMNVSIAIDDFGTGYSSLSKLKDYPVDKLKIDKSFVDNLPENIKSVILVKSMIGLAHNLGFKVVTEGVETRAQFDYLLENGSDQFQGYYFSKPVNAETFGNLIDN